MNVLALDTATEDIACALGVYDPQSHVVLPIADSDGPAPRAANTQLVPRIAQMCRESLLVPEDIGIVICGRGPGSFTGVRIAAATAKGIALGLHVPLHGVSTLDAVAWGCWAGGERGLLGVVADAMRGEVYPVRFQLDEDGVTRLEPDRVEKPEVVARRWADDSGQQMLLAGNGLIKYAQTFLSAFEELGSARSVRLLESALWLPKGSGLLAAFAAQAKADRLDSGDPSNLLPVYTRLSDAEENERKRIGCEEAIPASGVDEARAEGGLMLRPLTRSDVPYLAALEKRAFVDVAANDAWSEGMLLDEVGRVDRSWWVALEKGAIVGAAGGWVVDAELQVLDLVVDPAMRRQGIARRLLERLTEDGRALGAEKVSLEVRATNGVARALYAGMGFVETGRRPHYYPGGGDAVLMESPLPLDFQPVHTEHGSVAGMELSDSVDDGARVSHRHPLILAIESSCDETAAAVIDGDGVLGSDLIASQIDFHARFGGVVPEIASRKHIEAIVSVTDEALASAGRTFKDPQLDYRDLDAIAVTARPGLVGALVVGIAFAKGLAWACGKPLLGINHLEGHLYANRLITPDIKPPIVALLVSGGHTMLVHVKDWGDYETLGSTLDDAVGEAFDKVAKALGLGYPGGPVISRLAAKGNPKAIDFPRAMMHSGDLRFSLSGLKTAVITYINAENKAGRQIDMPDLAASFQQAVVDVLVDKTLKALKQTGAREFCLGGGVAANPELRDELKKAIEKHGVRVTLPPLSACTDNAGMIAEAALAHFQAGDFSSLTLDAAAHAPLDQE